VPGDERARLILDVAERRLDPYTAAERLFAAASAVIDEPEGFRH
jgi:hypothetical protein